MPRAFKFFIDGHSPEMFFSLSRMSDTEKEPDDPHTRMNG